MNVIVIKCADGSVQIMQLIEAKDATAEVEKWKLNASKYVSHREMPIEAIPTDRAFRNAWSDVTPELSIDVDMIKARDIQRDRIRAIRKPLLESLDVKSIQALESGDAATVASVVAQKKTLRDLPTDPRIDAAQTLRDLKAILPGQP